MSEIERFICFSSSFVRDFVTEEQFRSCRNVQKRRESSARQQCCDLLRPFAWNHNNVGTCCVQFETGQTFGTISPNVSIVL